MRFRQEGNEGLARLLKLLLLLIMAGGCLLLTIDAFESKDVWRILDCLILLAGCCCLAGTAYRMDRPIADRQTVKRERSNQENTLAGANDPLTGLPERIAFRTSLQAFLEKEAQPGTGKGICIIHINHYKMLSGILGDESGDRLLQIMSERIASSCRIQGNLFRVGVDDFAILMSEYAEPDEIVQYAEHFLSQFDSTVRLLSNDYHISLSIGYALYPHDAQSSEELVRYAELAACYAKANGMNCCRYAGYMGTAILTRLELENDLRKGIEREEFFIEYQPQVNLDSGKMVGLEALVRWNHPRRGIIPPSEFIPLAEECGFIVQLGEWVLRTACIQNKRWQDDGFEPISISVNMSMRQFKDSRFTSTVAQILQETGLDPRYLELEITESMTMDPHSAYGQLMDLKQLGILISIDDFGTGYSSLHYLKNLPIDRIKIDRSFLQEIFGDRSNAAIVSSITSMARHLKLKITAEGVENKEQLEFLKLQNCHDGQGYLFSKPVGAYRLEQDFLVRAAV
ncbi:putative bifunctional diguanylate cyclase/phosphodiesterase [Paenibacillus pinistramenti]|uniref:putative bifunctional diguanylate cyclase/phosphodiesterase n=1 Tax=Paenibacillus pinistramenti TaxID=1768003 RepID=UPI001108684D|nr:bifunctional diguanylate cyclase/phosphodiesterase [Paenibacillus pinistramenti]